MSAEILQEGHLLYGLRAIAAFLGVKYRQALYLVESGRLPVFREGRVICARRATLLAWMEKREKEGASNV